MEDNTLKIDKIIIVLIVVLIICILAIIGVISNTNKNNDESDEIAKLQEGGKEYSISELNNFDFDIVNLDNSIKEKINYNEFIINLKEYIYINGLVEADKAQYVNSYEEGNEISILFELNDDKHTNLTAVINISNYTCKFYEL